MKKLQELIKIVNSRRIQKVQILERSTMQDTLLYQLYSSISNGEFDTDEQAAFNLFKSEKQNQNYRKLKSNLKKRLYNNLFLLDINNTPETSYRRAHYTCIKHMALVRILVSNGARNDAMSLARKTLNQALKYTFTDVAIYCARVIKEMCWLSGQYLEFEKMSSLVRSLMPIQRAEVLAEDHRQTLLISFTRSVSVRHHLAKAAKRYLDQIKPLAAKHNSFSLHYNMYKVWISLHLLNNEYKSALRVLSRLYNYIEQHKEFQHNEVYGRISLQQLHCYLHLEDVKNGEKAAASCKQMFKRRSNNYFIFLEYYVLLNIRTENYSKATNIIKNVTRDPMYSEFPAPRQEKWRIFNAYVSYYREINSHQHDLFNLPRFLNEVPIYNKDKRGYNVAILIINIAFLLERERFDRIIDLADALRQYSTRWLKKDSSYRSNCFIKMLLIMELEGFEYLKTVKYTASYLKKLKQVRFEYHEGINDLEIIPYENLWEMILKNLKEIRREQAKLAI